MNLNVVKDVVRSKQSLASSDVEEHQQQQSLLDSDACKGIISDECASEKREWGWLNVRPKCLQWLNTSRWMLASVCMLTVFQGK